MFDFRRITLFCLEKRLSKNKMTMFSKILWGAWPLWPHLATPMSRTYSNGFIFSYKIIVSVIYSGVREGKRSTWLGPPSKYFARKYSSFLLKKLLPAHITFSEPHHNSVLCQQRGPEEQLQCVSRLLCFQRGPQQ